MSTYGISMDSCPEKVYCQPIECSFCISSTKKTLGTSMAVLPPPHSRFSFSILTVYFAQHDVLFHWLSFPHDVSEVRELKPCRLSFQWYLWFDLLLTRFFAQYHTFLDWYFLTRRFVKKFVESLQGASKQCYNFALHVILCTLK